MALRRYPDLILGFVALGSFEEEFFHRFLTALCALVFGLEVFGLEPAILGCRVGAVVGL
jgi:hypothetical protein